MQKKFQNLFFSPLLLKASKTQRIAYVALMTALSVVSNMFFELKFYDIQFSFTITVSCLIGVLIGSVFGFMACFLGDILGYLVNSWGQIYMPWVGLSTAVFAFIAGIVFNGSENKKISTAYIKTLIVAVFTFCICTILINTTGFYFYNKEMGFSTAVINYVNERFGSGVGYFGYLFYRLFFKGQIFNSLANYALLFIIIPLIVNNKKLRGEKNNENRT